MNVKKISDPQPPQGVSRILFRLPIWLYRAGLGWLLGKRFLLLTHTGRKSGKPRQAVLEIAKYDQKSNTYFVASGWGKQSNWYRNIVETPEVTIQVGRQRLDAVAEPLSPQESGEAMVAYARHYPTAARNLTRLIGYQVDGSEDAYRTLGQEAIPFVALHLQNGEVSHHEHGS